VRALCLLRDALAYRRDAYLAGLAAAGYRVEKAIPAPRRDDVLVIWNRYGAADDMARNFERHGARVIVTENGHLGKGWRGGSWYAMARGHHAGAGTWPDGGPARWDGWGVDLAPFRTGGDEILILAQRGIGENGLRSPPNWADRVREQLHRRNPATKARVRAHPAGGAPSIPLEEDLRNVRAVVTWHSAAAASSLLLGVPVFYDCPSWIGAEAGLPLARLFDGTEPKRDDAARLAMFRRLAWAMWNLDEIQDGTAFRHLLQREEAAA
jgi:hypothetical protein